MDANRTAGYSILATRFNPRIRDGCEAPEHYKYVERISFNPRIRDGCENVIDFVAMVNDVSIHASVMDANDRHSITRLVIKFQSTHP